MTSPHTNHTISVMPSEVCAYVKKLKNNKSPGLDTICNRMIKKFPVKIIFYLTKIVNVILQWQHFPEIWKTAKITPILKTRKPASYPDSYRPISLLSSLSKILEAVLLRRINDHLECNRIIIPHQFGFRRQHSTVNQLYRVVEFVTEGVQQKRVTGGLFLDGLHHKHS
ncbi:putative RNA-directed DNA polymerase from transposon X-element, partial [Stegodyphus mimosarum]